MGLPTEGMVGRPRLGLDTLLFLLAGSTAGQAVSRGESARKGDDTRVHLVVSDIHGHVEHLVRALQQASLLDSNRAWRGDQARLTVLGDFFDRGPDGIGVVDLIRRLQDEAGSAGGRVDALLGNHEILALGLHRFGDRLVRSRHCSVRTFPRSWPPHRGPSSYPACPAARAQS